MAQAPPPTLASGADPFAGRGPWLALLLALAGLVGPASGQEPPAGDERLERVQAEQAEAASRLEELEARRAELSQALEETAPPVEAPPPYSLRELDSWADRVSDVEAEAERAARALEDARDALEAARSQLEEGEKARRLARERAAAADPGPERDALERGLRERELRAELGRALVELRRLEEEGARARLAVEELAVRRAREQLAFVRERLAPRPGDLEEVLVESEKVAFDLARALERAKVELAAAERRLTAAEARTGAASVPTPEAREQQAALRSEVARRKREVALLEVQRERAEAAQSLWRRRHALLSGSVDREEAKTWLEEAHQELAEAERRQRIKSARQEELREEAQAVREQIPRADPAAQPWLRARAESLAERAALYARELASLADAQRLQRRLVADLERRHGTLDLGDRLRALRSGAARLWSYEIASSEDRPITLGKLVLALLAFAVGYLVALLVARLLGGRVFPRLGYDEGASHAFESLAFYALLVLAFLWALRTVNIPLTAFAVVGGALAIGVGFGSQNVVSNFISGVILLAERPIKLGDLVEVGGVYGTIERIGLRSTRVRTGDNVHIIVPNTSFLENNVINWTHNDEKVRAKLSVGVEYGSPTREVEAILHRVLSEHPKVLPNPEPFVLFTGFGESSLDFEVRFWIRMRALMDRLRVESDVRYRVDELFREAGIVIAFPQQDVHLDAGGPLEVRVLDAAGSGGNNSPAAASED